MEENHSLAYELLEEVKRSNDKLEKSNKRWFIIALVELAIIVSIVIGFVWYENQYETTASEDTYQYVDNTDMDNSTLNQSLGE